MKLIVAVDAQNVIGWSGDLSIPWSIPEDMRRFAELTKSGDDPTVVMGRKTWLSLPQKYRPLPGRKNYVLTRDLDFATSLIPTGAVPAMCGLESIPSHAWLIGGAQLYDEALDKGLVTELYITKVHRSSGADVRLKHDLYSWKLFAIRELAKGRFWVLKDIQALEQAGVTFLTLKRTL